MAWTSLLIEQGTTFSRGWAVTYNGQPLDDSWDVDAQIRSEPGGALLAVLSASVDADGAVVVAATALQTALWDWRLGVYDVRVTGEVDGSPVILHAAAGPVELLPMVTR